MDDARAKRKAGWRLMREAVRVHRGMMYPRHPRRAALGGGACRVPSLAGAAVDHGVAAGRLDRGAQLDDPDPRWSARCRPSAPASAATPRSGSRGASRPTCACGSSRTCRRLHFAFHDQAQTGQLMAYANTDIQQINNVGAADPAHDREHDPDGRGRGHPRARAAPASRCSRSARCRCSTSPRRASTTACIPVGLAAAGGAVGALGRRRGERHRHPGREGLRRRAAAARRGSRPRPTASTTARWTRRGCAPTSCR